MSHKIKVSLPEVNCKPALVLFLQVGNTGDVEQDLAEVVLVNRRATPVSEPEELAGNQTLGFIYSLSSSSTETSAAHPTLPTAHCIC